MWENMRFLLIMNLALMRQLAEFATRFSLRRRIEFIMRGLNTSWRSQEANHCLQFLVGISRVQA